MGPGEVKYDEPPSPVQVQGSQSGKGSDRNVTGITRTEPGLGGCGAGRHVPPAGVAV